MLPIDHDRVTHSQLPNQSTIGPMQERSTRTLGGLNETLVGVPSKEQTPVIFVWCLIPIFIYLCLWWCLETIASYYFARNQRQVRAQEEQNEVPPEVLRGNLVDLFKKTGNQMVRRNTLQLRTCVHSTIAQVWKYVFQVVTKERLKDDNNRSLRGDIEESSRDEGLLMLTKKDRLGQEFTVPSSCVVCFECYQEGEIVVWSCCAECPHVYHRSCFVEYLFNFKGEGSPCPSCRQGFCDLPVN
jgi:hypothetical protein